MVGIENIEKLPANEQQNIRDIFEGRILPPLYSDTIAKRILDADVHPERLNFLMRGIAKDPTIDVSSSAKQENFKLSLYSKSMISDIPSWLKDGRLSNLEMQKAQQDFIFTRVELYASDMLLLQYSVAEGEAKGNLDYSNVKEVLIIILMVESPETFRRYDTKSENYIHRFTKMTADTGLSYETKAKMIYVQLDKCLKQYKEGRNAEAADGKPDELQLWLSMIADVNDEQIKNTAEHDDALMEIRREASNMIQDKNVQLELIKEKYDRMDWATYGNQMEIRGAIKAYNKAKLSPTEIVQMIIDEYHIKRKDAEKYVEDILGV